MVAASCAQQFVVVVVVVVVVAVVVVAVLVFCLYKGFIRALYSRNIFYMIICDWESLV